MGGDARQTRARPATSQPATAGTQIQTHSLFGLSTKFRDSPRLGKSKDKDLCETKPTFVDLVFGDLA